MDMDCNLNQNNMNIDTVDPRDVDRIKLAIARNGGIHLNEGSVSPTTSSQL